MVRKNLDAIYSGSYVCASIDCDFPALFSTYLSCIFCWRRKHYTVGKILQQNSTLSKRVYLESLSSYIWVISKNDFLLSFRNRAVKNPHSGFSLGFKHHKWKAKNRSNLGPQKTNPASYTVSELGEGFEPGASRLKDLLCLQLHLATTQL